MSLLYQSPEWNNHRVQSVVPFAIVPDLPFFRANKVTLQGPRATLPTFQYGSGAPAGTGVAGGLIDVSEFQHLDGDQIRYVLTYSAAPPSYTNYQTYSYTYPATFSFPPRSAFSLTVTARVDITFALAAPVRQSGTTIAPPLAPDPIFQPTQGGVPVNFLSVGVTELSTVPTPAQYFASSAPLIAESSVRPYRPGLYIRETIRVPRR
jgi:hypothetical protein